MIRGRRLQEVIKVKLLSQHLSTRRDQGSVSLRRVIRQRQPPVQPNWPSDVTPELDATALLDTLESPLL